MRDYVSRMAVFIANLYFIMIYKRFYKNVSEYLLRVLTSFVDLKAELLTFRCGTADPVLPFLLLNHG